MSDKIQKNYYAIIPADVRYNKRLKPLARLLYGEITALCNEKGYCWASNSYFAELYEVSDITISRYISELKEYGYIKCIYDKTQENIDKRKIYIIPSYQNGQDGINRNDNTVLTKQSIPSYQNNQDGINRNVKHNNTDNNTNNNTGRGKENPPPPSSDFNLFSKHLVGVFTRLTAKTALDLFQLDGFRTPQKREELRKLFENRHFDWEGCIKYAENECLKAQISKRWLEFLSILRLVLRDGADGIKRHLTAEELAEKQELEKIKQAEMEELAKKHAEEERAEREEYKRIQLEKDKQEAEKLGISLEEYQEQRRIEEEAYFRDLKADLCN